MAFPSRMLLLAATLVAAHCIVLCNSYALQSTTALTRRQAPRHHVARNSVEDEVLVHWEDDDDDDNDDEFVGDDFEQDSSGKPKKTSRWDNLNPKLKEQLRQKGVQRAIANKKKVEPVADKKRRLMMYVKEQTIKKKRASKIHRPIPFNQRDLALADLQPNQELEGTVISLTKFGAYVDVGTEIDGLLHVSQLSRQVFVEHPRQLLSPGDVITVRVRSCNPDKRKLHLTMLDPDVVEREIQQKSVEKDRLPLEELQVDDELWGELKRVTDYGAYVEVGAQVDGWLHFMDHPSWVVGSHPSEFMQTGDRVRVWVADLDLQQKRMKLTAQRPNHLPGPRRELY